MREVQTFFLRTKHWQLFLPLASLSLLAGGLVYIGGLSKSFQWGTEIFEYAVWIAWLASAGSFLGDVLQPRFKINTRLFYVALIFPALFMPFDLWLAMTKVAIPMTVLFPLQAFDTACLFYQLYFVARGLAMAEIESTPVFEQWIGTFLLLLFWPIGIWVIQPRVNDIFDFAQRREQPLIPKEAL